MKRTVALCYSRKSKVRKGAPAPASPEVQDAATVERAHDLRLTPELYRDAEGHRTGKDALHRPDWQKVMARLADADVAALIVYSHDRAFRNLRALLETADRCKELGVRLILVKDNIDIETAQGRFLLSLLGGYGEFESNIASERRIATIDWLRRNKGRHYGSVPFGAERVPKDGDLVLAPSDKLQPNGTDHAALVRLYELWAAERPSLDRLAAMLNCEGWRYRSRAGGLREWNRDDVRRLLVRHWIYSGYVIDGKIGRDSIEVLPGSHAPILPEHLTAAVAAAGLGRKLASTRRPPQLHPLTGILYCANCGNPLYGTTAHDGAPHRFYRHRLACDLNHCQKDADAIEREVRNHLAALRWPSQPAADAEVNRVLAAESRGQSASGERARIGQALERLRSLFTWGDLSEADYHRERDALLAKIPSDAAMPSLNGVGLPTDAEAIQAAPPGMLRELVRALYERIDMDMEGELAYITREWCREWA